MVIKPNKNQEFLEFMVWFVRMFEPNLYVEVGVKRGYTFNAIAPLVKRAIAIDIVPFEPKVPDGTKTLIEVHIQKGPQCIKTWSGDEPVDLLFIDADHHKERVLEDFNLFSIYVREGTGFIFLHDTHPVTEGLCSPRRSGDAWKAAWEIRTSEVYRERFEIVTFPGPWSGLSIIRKSKTQLAWKQG